MIPSPDHGSATVLYIQKQAATQDGQPMSLTIHLPPEQEAQLKARAGAAGLEAESYVQQLLERDLKQGQVESIAHLQREDPAAWGRQLEEWFGGDRPDRPALDPATICREDLYPDRA